MDRETKKTIFKTQLKALSSKLNELAGLSKVMDIINFDCLGSSDYNMKIFLAEDDFLNCFKEFSFEPFISDNLKISTHLNGVEVYALTNPYMLDAPEDDPRNFPALGNVNLAEPLRD